MLACASAFVFAVDLFASLQLAFLDSARSRPGTRAIVLNIAAMRELLSS